MPEPHLRAADADRAAVADALGVHMSTGRLTVAEYDERLARAYAARTYGELAELTADLPPVAPPPAPVPATTPAPAPAARYGACAGSDLRRSWASWATTAVIVLAIWVFTMAAAASWIYPWPFWVVVPWGVVLLRRSFDGGPGRRSGSAPR